MAVLMSTGHQFLMEKVNDSFQLTEAGWARALDLVAEVCGVLEGRVEARLMSKQHRTNSPPADLSVFVFSPTIHSQPFSF